MNIYLIAVGNRMPRWVDEGYQEYARRLPGECALKLVEIAPGHRGKGADIRRTLRDEGERMRITSYNVCYTKLLRPAQQLEISLQQQGALVKLLQGGLQP